MNMCTVIDQQFILQIPAPTIVWKTLVASPDLRHAAFIARYRDAMTVIFDEVESERFDGMVEASLVFSSDSKYLAYIAVYRGKQCVVLDGVPGPAFDVILSPPRVSADGRHLAYSARISGTWHVVSNEQAFESAHGIALVTMSPDGSRLAWAALQESGLTTMVVDGTPGPLYDAPLQGSVTFSPDSKHLAYAVHIGGQQLVVRDGVEGPRFHGVPGPPVYSADSQRLLHPAGDGTQQFLVVDETPGHPFDHIVIGENHLFSLDGQHTACSVQIGGCQHVAVDDVAGAPYDGISVATVRLSADGRRVGFVARLADARYVVCDGLETRVPNNAWGLSFSTDNKHLAYVANVGRRHVVFVDGNGVFECDGIINTCGKRPLLFEAPEQLRFMALIAGGLYSVVVKL